MKEDIEILLITGGNPENKSAAENINKLLKILRSITNNIHLITFCNSELISGLDNEKIHSLQDNKNRFKQFLYSQIFVSKEFILLSRTYNIKTVLFAFGCDLQLVPLILTKITGKKIVIRSDGRPTTVLNKYFKTHSQIKRIIFRIIEEIDYKLADIVLTECEYMILENNFQKYNARVGNLFVDVEKFANNKTHNLRKYDIGFVGQLVKRKGILNLLSAFGILDERYNILIKGDGEEKNNVLRRIQVLKYKFKIDYVDWTKREKLPDYLNEIKMLVVPSYTEGLPNIILEAMACGTPVLATPVGGIPGVIQDGETGFIMENNSPACIAKNVMRALEHSDLERIVKNARAQVERKFSYKATVKRWVVILDTL